MTLRHLIEYFKINKVSNKLVYILGIMLLFWAIFDGIISYITPIVIINNGISETLMGIIIGTSSVAGALFDFIACRIFKNHFYKRLFLLMFALCLVYPLILFKANSFVIYLIAMAIWGIYYDLKNIAIFNFVGRFTKRSEHSDSFGLLEVFLSIGYLIAPILIGFVIAESFDWKPFALAWIFIGISLIFYLVLISLDKNDLSQSKSAENKKQRNIWSEIRVWSDIGKLALPVLLLTMFLNIIDSFFWTIGPLFAESLSKVHQFAGFFMTAFTLPALIVGWYVGKFTRKFGKKNTAFTSLLIGSIFLLFILFISNPIWIIIDIFVASIFFSLAWPAVNGAYADYISETVKFENEITGLEDFYTNIGYIIGPILAGFIAERIGYSGAFFFLGTFGIVLSLLLLALTPKSITLNKNVNS